MTRCKRCKEAKESSEILGKVICIYCGTYYKLGKEVVIS